MYYPEFPKAGDTLGITAPSAGIGHKIASFDCSLEMLKEQGYALFETKSVRTDGSRSAPAAVRGEEFNELVLNPSVRAILSASGGDYNLEMLPYVDWEAICYHPKWIAGASDPTNLLFPITTKLDIATIYGWNAGSFDWRPLHAFQRNALSILSGTLVSQESFEKYDGSRTFSDEGPVLSEEVWWDLLMPDGESRLDLSGRLIGGCLDCISKLIGTPFDGTAEFIERYREEQLIWFFDPFEMSADQLYLTLLQMKYAGYFRTTAGVIIGRVMFPCGSTDEEYQERLRMLFDAPVILNADIGHVKPCMTLINGAVAHVTSEKGKGAIEMALL